MFRSLRLATWLTIVAAALEAAEPSSKVTAIYAMDADGANAREVARIPDYPIINSPEVSPDGRRIAVDGWKRRFFAVLSGATSRTRSASESS